MQNILIIDANSIGYASHSATKLHVNGREVQAIFNSLKTIRNLILKHKDYVPYVLWDGHAQFRYDIHPSYKGDRDSTPEKVKERNAYKQQKPDIFKALYHLGVIQMRDAGLEADDLAGILVDRINNSDAKAILVTGDKDWIQLVNKNVTWFDPIRDRQVTHKTFPELTGFATSQQFVEGKALTGDTSDTIPGVGGIGEKGAPEFLMNFQSVYKFFERADAGELDGKQPAAIRRFRDNEAPKDSSKYGKMLPMRDAFERNMALMDLRVNRPFVDLLKARGKFNKEKFENFCNELSFLSITKNLDVWLRPFAGE